MRDLILIFIAFSFFSCSDGGSYATFELGRSQIKYSSINEYFEASRSAIIDNGSWIKFMFLNNPYNLNSENMVSIFVNSHLVYRGRYKRHLELKGLPEKIFSLRKGMTVSLEILTDGTRKNLYQHDFRSKTEFSWNKDYKIIYCGFFPSNEDIERVYFIPQLEAII